MENKPQAPTERELEVLKILWDIGPATVRQVWEIMGPGEDLAQNTVQTFLRMMEDKGLVKHKPDGRSFVYEATYSRQRTLTRFMKRVFDGAADQLVLSLLADKSLSEAELKSIEQLIKQEKKRRGL